MLIWQKALDTLFSKMSYNSNRAYRASPKSCLTAGIQIRSERYRNASSKSQKRIYKIKVLTTKVRRNHNEKEIQSSVPI